MGRAQVYEQVEMRAGFPEEAMAVYQRGLAAMMAGKKDAPRKDRAPSLLDPATARGARGPIECPVCTATLSTYSDSASPTNARAAVF